MANPPDDKKRGQKKPGAKAAKKSRAKTPANKTAANKTPAKKPPAKKRAIPRRRSAAETWKAAYLKRDNGVLGVQVVGERFLSLGQLVAARKKILVIVSLEPEARLRTVKAQKLLKFIATYAGTCVVVSSTCLNE